MQVIKQILFCIRFYRSLDISTITEVYKLKLRNEDEVWEKTINEILLYNLSRRIIKDNLSHEFAEGFKSALLLRNSLKSLAVEKGIDK